MAQQVAVPPASAAAADLDPVGYQDAFAVRTPVRRSAEEWMRLGLEGMPPPVRAVVLGAQGPICTARIVFSVTDGDGVLATLLRFDRPRARRLWTVLAPVHRAVARLLLDRTARVAARGHRPEEARA